MTDASLPLDLANDTPISDTVVPVSYETSSIAAKESPADDNRILEAFKTTAQSVLDHLKTLTGADIRQICNVTTMPPNKTAPNDYVLVLTPRTQSRYSPDRLPASPFQYSLTFSEKGRVELAILFCSEAKNLHHASDESLYVAYAREKTLGRLGWGRTTTAKLDTRAIAQCLVENMRADGVYASLPRASL